MPNHETLKDFYKNKSVLVTGGAGFIGSNLVDKLVDLGAKVTVFDDFSTGKFENLEKSLNKIRLIIGDITSQNNCAQALEGQKIVFHLAAKTSISKSENELSTSWKINVNGTEELLKQCRNISAFVFSSSAAVYGNRQDICKEIDPKNPISKYGQSKAIGEELCKQYERQYNLKTVILRYFNVVGDRQDKGEADSSAVVKFTKNITNGTKLTIFGDGNQLRDFVNVSKVVQANILTAAYCDKNQFNVFNVANGKSITILELIKQLEQNLGIKCREIEHKPANNSDIFSSLASCSKYNNFVEKIIDYLDGDTKDDFIKSNINLYSNSP